MGMLGLPERITNLMREQTKFVDMADQITPKDGINRESTGISQTVLDEIEAGDLEFYYCKGEQKIEMITTPCHKGGGRLWFKCPKCGKRAGKLYRPILDIEYLCRGCHGLVYRSQYKALTAKELLELVKGIDTPIQASRKAL